MSKTAKILFLLWFLSMFLFASFFGSKGTKMTLEGLELNVTSQDELYFKNIRSFYYSVKREENLNIDTYNLDGNNSEHPLNPTICHAWKSNQAFVLFENLSPFHVELKTKEKNILISSENMNGKDQLHLAFLLYVAIEENQEVSLIREKEKVLVKSKEMKNIGIVLKDYFKLIGALR